MTEAIWFESSKFWEENIHEESFLAAKFSHPSFYIRCASVLHETIQAFSLQKDYEYCNHNR